MIPSDGSITTIGTNAFYGSGITSIDIPTTITAIGASAFYKCSSLTSIELPNSLTTIASSLFYACGLTSVTIPSSITSIGSQAFQFCRLTSITIPSSVTAIHKEAFGTVGLDTVNYLGTIESWCRISFGVNPDTKYYYQSNPLCNGADLYINDVKITDLIIPKGYYIGDKFQGCTSIQSVTIPSSVSYIDPYTFSGCINLQTVSIQRATPPSLGYGAFPSNVTIIVPCGSSEAYWENTEWAKYVNYEEAFLLDWQVMSSDTTQGSVNITKSPNSCDDNTAIFNAVPATHYKFVSWSDDNTDNPRSTAITDNTTYTATFAPVDYNITVTSSSDNTWGTVTGTGKYPYGSRQYIKATPNKHYKFVSWNDGDINASRRITIGGDSTFVATFVPVDYNITVTSSSNSAWGTVEGSGSYPYGSTQTIQAIPAEHYKFVSWNDGNTDAERTITVGGEATYRANFAPIDYNITVTSASESAWGSVRGTGSYQYGSTRTIRAIPNKHYEFVSWNDGNTNAERIITVEGDSTFIASFAPKNYVITVLSSSTTAGAVTGSGTYPYNSEQTIKAIPSKHYKFVSWNDGNTNAERTIKVGGEATYTATFAPEDYDVLATSANPDWGYAEGTGSYPYGSTQYIEAIPNKHYKFVSWNDGNTDAERFITISGDTTFTATFAPVDYSITVTSASEKSWGSVEGTDSYPYNTQQIIKAIPNEHYKFVSWSDGNTNAERIIVITGNATYAATFAPLDYSIVVSSENPEWGSVEGTGTYPYGSWQYIKAIPNEHYKFVSWNDGNTNPERTITVGGNATFTATFAPIDYAIMVTSASNKAWGTVTGTGAYPYGSKQMIQATPAEHYKFVSWNDGNTNAERVITVSAEATYTATFAPVDYNITVKSSSESAWGSVTGTGSYSYGSEQVIRAIPSEHYKFVSWNDGVTTTERIITIDGDATYTATFAPVDYTITVDSNNDGMGTVTGSGSYPYGSKQTITATPNEHYKFVSWSDGDTNIERTITVDGDATYTATFAPVDYFITVTSSNSEWGSVEGTGSYPYGSEQTIRAIPTENYIFVSWHDGDTNAERTITVSGDASYIATFVLDRFEADGIYYKLLNDNDVTVIAGQESYTGDIAIPEETSYKGQTFHVTAINESAFANSANLTSINIANSIMEINNAAFTNCINLQTVTIGTGLEKLGVSAFANCVNLKTFICHSTQVKEAEEAKNNADIVSYANKGAFVLTNKNLDSIIAPAQFFDIAEEAWSYLVSTAQYIQVNGGELTKAAFSVINRSHQVLNTLDIAATTNTKITDEAFQGSYGLQQLILPTSLEEIGNKAFEGCQNLQELMIPATVVKIGESAFEDCRSLEILSFGNEEVETYSNTSLESIGAWSFWNCVKLEYLEIPEGVLSIGDNTFYGCISLVDLILPSTLEDIGDNCFENGSKMRKATSHAPQPPTIQSETFKKVDHTIPLYVPAESIEYYANDIYWGEFINIIPIGGTGIEDVETESPSSVRKVFENGTLYIVYPNGDKYLFDGRKVN